MEGEANFKVAHNPDKPFVVTNKEVKVEVLGTHFNFMSYANEPNAEITFLEGGVPVRKNQQKRKLTPNQQTVNNQ